jgi:hypothetical protein
MLCQHESNEINMFELPEDEKYGKETVTGDEPLQGSQPTQIAKKSKSHMHQAPDEKAENAHNWSYRQEDQTAHRVAANTENIALSRRLRRVD